MSCRESPGEQVPSGDRSDVETLCEGSVQSAKGEPWLQRLCRPCGMRPCASKSGSRVVSGLAVENLELSTRALSRAVRQSVIGRRVAELVVRMPGPKMCEVNLPVPAVPVAAVPCAA